CAAVVALFVLNVGDDRVLVAGLGLDEGQPDDLPLLLLVRNDLHDLAFEEQRIWPARQLESNLVRGSQRQLFQRGDVDAHTPAAETEYAAGAAHVIRSLKIERGGDVHLRPEVAPAFAQGSLHGHARIMGQDEPCANGTFVWTMTGAGRVAGILAACRASARACGQA